MDIKIPYDINKWTLFAGSKVPEKISRIDINISGNGNLIIKYCNSLNQSLEVVSQLTDLEYSLYIEKIIAEREESIKNILSIFEEVFQKEWYQYTIINDKCEFLIKFDKFVIENKKGETHNIRDLFIRLVYNIPNKRFTDFSGVRKTLTKNEYSYSYGHSHLDSYRDWGSFCLGDGDYEKLYNNIRVPQNTNMENDLRSFLYGLYPYLCWENLDANCYKYISKINENSRIHFENPDITYISDTDIQNLINTHDLDKFIVFDQTEFIATIPITLQYLKEISASFDDKFKSYYDDELLSFSSLSSGNTFNEITDICPLKFKDKDYSLNIIENDYNEDLSTYHRLLSPNIVNKISEFITDKFIQVIKNL